MLDFLGTHYLLSRMKTAYWIGAGLVAIVIIVLAVKMLGSTTPVPTAGTASSTVTTQTTSTTTTTTVSGQGSAPAANTSGSATAPAPSAQHFTVNGNDATADLKVITVAAGTPVTITFGADAGTTYHGGLDFRSSVLNTGTITPGSTKTVSFTATKSFSFTPYWPSTNIAKPYTIDIVVR